jgi:hypothetical protein
MVRTVHLFEIIHEGDQLFMSRAVDNWNLIHEGVSSEYSILLLSIPCAHSENRYQSRYERPLTKRVMVLFVHNSPTRHLLYGQS